MRLLLRQLRRRIFSNFLAPLSSRSTHAHSHYAHNIPFNIWWKLIPFTTSARACRVCESRPGALMIRTVERVKKKRNPANPLPNDIGERVWAEYYYVCSLFSLAHAKLVYNVYSLFCSPRAQRMLDVFYLFRSMLTAFVITTWAGNESERFSGAPPRAQKRGRIDIPPHLQRTRQEKVFATSCACWLRESYTQFRSHSRSRASWLRDLSSDKYGLMSATRNRDLAQKQNFCSWLEAFKW